MEVKQRVDDIIAGNVVAVFSKSYCPYCKMAKSALKDAGLQNYFLLELDSSDTKNPNAIQDYLLELTGGRTVPRVFVKGKFIGGGSELQSLQQSGELKRMLQEAGAL